LFKFLRNILTGKRTSIPLIYIRFNYKKYKKEGKMGSCLGTLHPDINNDEIIVEKLKELIDLIRERADLEKL
jgi:hypothetical protein